MLLLPAAPTVLKSFCADKSTTLLHKSFTQPTSPATSSTNTHSSTTFFHTTLQEKTSDSFQDDLDDQEINTTLHSASLIVSIALYYISCTHYPTVLQSQ